MVLGEVNGMAAPAATTPTKAANDAEKAPPTPQDLAKVPPAPPRHMPSSAPTTSEDGLLQFGRPDGKAGVGMAGGKSWTKKWLSFDNSYFTGLYEKADQDLLVLATDKALTQDPSFKPTCELYAKSQEAFFIDYASVHSRLSELGSKFDPPEGITLS